MKKKLLALLFAAAMLAGLLVSCKPETGKPAETGGTTKVTGGTGSAGSDTEPPRPKLPDVTYGGYNFRFYSWDIDGWYTTTFSLTTRRVRTA